MAIEWSTGSVQYAPTLTHCWSGQGEMTITGTKSLAEGGTRAIWVKISWGGESDNPGDTVLFSEAEEIWDALVGAGYTVTEAGVTTPDTVGFSAEKA